MLVGLCRAPDRLFVTADANQSIYGSGFRWTDVHAEGDQPNTLTELRVVRQRAQPGFDRRVAASRRLEELPEGDETSPLQHWKPVLQR